MKQSWVLVVGLALVGLGCGDDDVVGGACTIDSDCEGAICVDGRCAAVNDGGVVDTFPLPDGVSRDSDGTDAGCATMIFCGDPPICCAAGTECIAGSCLAECSTGVRCGGSCCENASDVCIDGTCAMPGDECGDNFDCPADTFCEPTIGRCLPQFDPITCETDPVFGDFEVTTELSLTSSTRRPTCFQAISPPVVVDLDGDGIPEIMSNMACDSNWTDGALRAFRGDTGEELWASDINMDGRASIAAGDLTGTGDITIVGLTSPNGPDPRRVIAFDASGNELWRSADGVGARLRLASDNGAPTFADLDGDGNSEIVWGALVLDAGGRLVWRSGGGDEEGTNSGYAGGISVVVDLDGDGNMDVVSGARAWNFDGTLKWAARNEAGAAAPDGYPAVAQFDDDPQAEVVLVASGNVYVIDGASGIVQWGPVVLPGGGRGGPPTVADFDGDGQPEIGVAGGASYTVYDPTGDRDVLWSATTIDVSSNATGSSVFDFQGDGAAEVVYQDECHIWVYDGSDGSVLLSIESSSATIHEYPIVVDVDGDGNSELVTVANNRAAACAGTSPAGYRRGIFVYGDARDQWVRTRRIWNQHAYSVTNVGSAGEIPAVPRSNWEVEGLNNFRQNAQGEGVFNAPDLQVGLEVRLDGCPDRATLRARVTNEGNLGVMAGVPVVFYEGTLASPGAEVARSATTMPLLPGASEVIEVVVDLPEIVGGASFVVVVDAPDGAVGGAVEECREDNNAGDLSGVECNLLI